MSEIGSTAIKKAQDVATGALARVRGQLGVSSYQMRKLTMQEQLERFVSMSPAELDYLRKQHGDIEYARYTEAMIRLARRQNYGR